MGEKDESKVLAQADGGMQLPLTERRETIGCPV